MKISHDENAAITFGKQPAKGAQKSAALDKNAFVTPILGPQTRAPLGMKTTNAKTKVFQTPGVPVLNKQGERTVQKQTSARRPKKATHAEAVKLKVLGDESPLKERDCDVEYCPPRVKEMPYESEDFPDGCLDYTLIRGKNLMSGIPSHHTKLDTQGRTRLDKVLEDSFAKSAKKTDECVLKMMEEQWTVGDVPETFHNIQRKDARLQAAVSHTKPAAKFTRAPSTVSSRRAVSALSDVHANPVMQPKAPKKTQKPMIPFMSRPKPEPAMAQSTLRQSAVTNISRSTLGYSKGRSASGALSKPTVLRDTFVDPAPIKRARGGMQRSVSTMSTASDSTITPAKFQKEESEIQEWKKKLPFLQAFDLLEDNDLEPGLRGVVPESLRRMDEDDEEEFVLTLGGDS
ncbi:hypothetical protein M7I_4311 [Glarea lozoyensis 74030]|nr:hypothetical protein M7I_4311 [Glarea lozoyensis 74030]